MKARKRTKRKQDRRPGGRIAGTALFLAPLGVWFFITNGLLPRIFFGLTTSYASDPQFRRAGSFFLILFLVGAGVLWRVFDPLEPEG